MRTKRDHEKAVRTTISMPPELWEIAESERKSRRLSSFSDVIQDLIRDAIDRRAALAGHAN